MSKVNVVIKTYGNAQSITRFRRVFLEKTGLKNEDLNIMKPEDLDEEQIKKIVIFADNQMKEKDEIFSKKHRDKHSENVKDLDFDELAKYIVNHKNELKNIIYNEKNVAFSTVDLDCDYFISDEMLAERERDFMEQVAKLD